MVDLYQLANLVQQRNQLEHAMAQLISEPFTPAKVAEFLARRVFGIHSDERTPFDGYFAEGALAGKSVAIRYLPERGRLYSFKASLTEPQPDYYLLMVGADGRRKHALQVPTAFTIDAVYLVDARRDAPLWETKDKAFPEWLKSRQVYPEAHCPLITLSDEQRDLLERFSLAELESELRWQQAFERSQEQLTAMAEAAHQAYLRGETTPLTLE